MPIGSAQLATTTTVSNPKQWYRLPGAKVDPGVATFYKVDAPAFLGKNSKSPDGLFVLKFLNYCSQEQAQVNEKIFSVLKQATLPKRAERPAGAFSFLVQLQDRNCLTAAQYKRLASAEVKELQPALPKLAPADLVASVYYLLHGGFEKSVGKADIVNVARAQQSDGDWVGGTHVNYVTSLYGAYVWAFVLSQGGEPVTFEEYEAALKGPPEPHEIAGK